MCNFKLQQNNFVKNIAMLFGIVGVLVFLWTVSVTHAAFNEQINYQGKLLDATAAAVPDGAYAMTFSLYTAPTGGGAIWTENATSTVTSGLFSSMLGSSTSLSGVDFNQTLYLGINVEGDGEMTPRKTLGAVPAAFQASEADNAQTLGGVASTSFLRTDQADTIAASEASTLLTITQNGAGDILNLFDGGTEVFTVTDGGDVGIGTTTPSQKLTVDGAALITGAFYDNAYNAGGAGYVLQSTGSGFNWVATSSLNTNPFGTTIDPTELTATDFGSFTCNGTTCTLDTGSVATAQILDDTVGFLDVSYTNTLAGNPALGASEQFFGTTGLLFEGSTTDTLEGLLTTANITGSDKTWTLPNTTGNIALTSSAMTGTFDGNNFGGGAIGAGDILYGSAAGTIAELAGVATGNVLISGGVATAPAWGKVGLSSHVSGVLAEANGGTNQSTYTTGDFLYASGANTLAKRTIGTTGQILQVSGGLPTWVATSSLGILSSLFTDGGASTYLTSLTDNVGIGTTSPNAKLDVWGDFRVGTSSDSLALFNTAANSINFGTDATSTLAVRTDFNLLNTKQVFKPSSPIGVGSITDGASGADELSGPQSISVYGNYAYVTGYSDNGVQILDISDPTNPIGVGSIIDGANGADELAGAYDITIAGNYAYVTGYFDNGVQILDISDPTNPIGVGSITDGASGADTLAGATSIAIAGNYAYVTGYSDNGVQILDISDPTSPVGVGFITDGASGADTLAGAYDITIAGNYAYVTGYSDNGVQILDISDPTNPIGVGSIIDGANGADELAGAFSIVLDGNHAYVTGSSDDGVQILDISDPTNPVGVGSITDGASGADELSIAISIAIAGNYAYVTGYTDNGVQILDISDPTNPVGVGSITDGASGADTLAGTRDITIAGNYAYVTGFSDNGVQILDLGGLETPTAEIGNLLATDIQTDRLRVAQLLTADGGLNVGHNALIGGQLSITGNSSTTLATNAAQLLIGGNTNRDSYLAFANGANDWSLGLDQTDNSFRIGSSSVLGNNDYFTIAAGGNIGIGTTTPSQKLTVDGSILITGALYDNTYNAGTNGNFLMSTGSGFVWTATSSLGLGNGTFTGLSDTQSSLTANRLLFANSGGTALTDSAGLTFDGTDLNLGVSNGLSFGGTRMLYASSTSGNLFFGENAGHLLTPYLNDTIAIGKESSMESINEGGVTIGYQAGRNNISGGGGKTILIGNEAGKNHSGAGVVGIGNNAAASSTGDYNTFIGWYSGYENNGDENSFYGDGSGAYNNGSYNNFFGYGAGNNNVGSYNNFLGRSAGQNNIGTNNSFLGDLTGQYLQANNTIALGSGALRGNNSGGTKAAFTADNNVAIGYQAGYNATTSASNNILLGYQAADSLTTGANNIIIGYDVEAPSNTGSNQLNIGNLLFGTGIDGVGTTLSSGNIGIGTTSPNAKLTVAGNINIDSATAGLSFMGTRFLYASTTNGSIALGETAGETFATDTLYNVALGYQAGQYASTTGTDYNNYLGYRAGESNTGADNNLFGRAAGLSNTGDYNSLIGLNAGLNNSGSYNQFLGYQTGLNNTGSNNNLFGYQTGYANTGSYNELIGDRAGRWLQATNTVAIGSESLFGPGSAYQAVNNTALGYRAGYSAQTGASNNILLGYQAADSLTTGANNIIIGYDVEAPSNTGSNQLNIGNLIFGTGIDGTGTTLSSGNVGIGTSTPDGKLSIENLTLDGTGVSGIDQYLTTTNSVASAVQYGNRYYLNASNTATTTLVGSMYRIADNTDFGNTVRGLEVQTNKGVNTLGENTALSGFARTFGVRGYTSADAGGSFEPAGGYFETGGTTQGNALRGYSGSITTATLLSLFQDTSTFAGTGLEMNFGNTTGSFSSSSSKYLDFQNGGSSVFTVSAFGTTTIGDGTTNNMAGLQIGYGGICVDNDGSCVATTTGQIISVSSATGNSDLAEMYFSAEDLEPGELVVMSGGLSIGRATQESTVSVFGVVSTKPGLTLGFDDTSLNDNENPYPVALSGRVPVRLSTENGPIKKGDQLALSSLPGVAMKATGVGVTVGIALEDFDDSRLYSDTYLNQFGDDMVDPVYEPVRTNTDPRINDGCYFAGGVATGEVSCVPLVATTTSGQIAEVNDRLEQVSRDEQLVILKNKSAQRKTLATGEKVSVGQVVMFVNLGYRYFDEVTNSAFATVINSTSTALQSNGDIEEVSVSLLERLTDLTSRFFDGVLTLVGLRAETVTTDELCIGGTCVNEAQLIKLLETGSAVPTNAATPPTEAEEGVTGGGTDQEISEEIITDPVVTTSTTTVSTPVAATSSEEVVVPEEYATSSEAVPDVVEDQLETEVTPAEVLEETVVVEDSGESEEVVSESPVIVPVPIEVTEPPPEEEVPEVIVSEAPE